MNGRRNLRPWLNPALSGRGSSSDSGWPGGQEEWGRPVEAGLVNEPAAPVVVSGVNDTLGEILAQFDRPPVMPPVMPPGAPQDRPAAAPPFLGRATAPFADSDVPGAPPAAPAVAAAPPAAVAQDTSAELFRTLTSRHLNSAYRLAWAILGDDEDAADATQDALMSAWRQRGTLRDPSRFDAWVGRILINICRDRLRQRARRGPRAGEADWESVWVADTSAVTSTRDELDRAMAHLDPDHRIVVILRFWADLTVDDIAERAAIPAGTVKSRLHHAMRTLRAALEETQ